MPQINRIRVNNVKYNFGTQYYDDFMMRFSGKNTLYDLANGGGKSLLMLLLMQNMIPNCTLDDKQPIEKLFRGDSGNTTIHSLIEWNLDPCYRKDNYKYMLTGFCARKARNTSSEQQAVPDGYDTDGTGTSQASSVSAASQAVSANDQASVEYFNYVIFYREFGDNDIRNLPLSKDGKKVTYQELKDYLRDLEKKDFGVSVKIFDRKGDYQNFISGYGIYESEWEIVRGINKTEGHVRTYFETNYRTSRKVVEDLLIEEIIQKSFHNITGNGNDDDRMARTLLDIKDKLVELSRKHAIMDEYDMQIQAIDEFAQGLSDFESIYRNKNENSARLVRMLAAARKKSDETAAEEQSAAEAIERIQIETDREHRLIDTAEIIEQKNSMKEVGELLRQSEQERSSAVQASESLRLELTLKECIADYREYLEYKRQFDEITQIIDNRLRDHEDIAAELRNLASYKKSADDIRRHELLSGMTEAKALLANEENVSNTAADALKAAESGISKALGRSEYLKNEITSDENAISGMLGADTVLVAENASDELAGVNDEAAACRMHMRELEEKLASVKTQIDMCRTKLDRTDTLIEVNGQQAEKLEQELAAGKHADELFDKLCNVYSQKTPEGLARAVSAALKETESQFDKSMRRRSDLEVYAESLKNGVYVCRDEQYDKVWDYLQKQYGEDAMQGSRWYAGLKQGQKRDIIKRVPFIHNGFIIKNDFERVRADTVLGSFNGAYAVPVISENVLYDMKLEVNNELVTFASRDMSFLTEPSGIDNEIKKCSEEIAELDDVIARLSDRRDVIREDYDFAVREAVKRSDYNDSPAVRLEKLKAEAVQLAETRTELIGRLENLNTSKASLTREYDDESQREAHDLKRAELLQKITELFDRAVGHRAEVKQLDGMIQEYSSRKQKAGADLSASQERAGAYRSKIASVQSALERMDVQWTAFAPYYSEDYEAGSDNTVNAQQFSEQDLESRFAALRSIIEQDTSDITDKEKLKNHLAASMDKCCRMIEYRRMSVDDVRKALDDDSMADSSNDALMSIRDRLAEYDGQIASITQTIESQSALYNRLDGSIAHGIYQIEEKYGSYEEFECANTAAFKEQHTALVAKMRENKARLSDRQKETVKQHTKLEVMIKDMERIIRAAGIDEADADVTGADENVALENYMDYENVQKELERILVRLEKRKDTFAKQKAELTDRLRRLEAADLADEFTRSLDAPADAKQCEELAGQLKETNEYIALERDNVAKSTEDMERIKESFENRCLQTCSNIKTELDRLPQLSTITLDGKLISIIDLQIPYVKEESYKERMSAYIDETVTAAESFRDAAQRLQYIRNRLTWKRLFSVIVTDMDAIRVNLYKRERIGDQSRFLKYEEAVGSTGQSQGIYIQFLIAVINYISNINAATHGAAVTGKVIFIDNPFGAAKDIYIWEPIFKLLKTNHVQLIVPARGATPAITGRFDVNYILGQKMAGRIQQTVVVDYQSNIERENLEYTRIEYEQQTLDLL